MRRRIYSAVALVAITGSMFLAPTAQAQIGSAQIKISGDGPLEGATLTSSTDVFLDLASPGQVEFVRWILKNPYGRTIDKARDGTVPFTYKIAERRDGHYTLAADMAVIGADMPRVRAGFWFGPPPGPQRVTTDDARHHGVNCNTISNPGGMDHRVCIMVNAHDVYLWREALAALCDGPTGADWFWLDRIWLERNGNTVQSNSNKRWVEICGGGARNSYSTGWDDFCSPGPQPIWQAHMRFALGFHSGKVTNILEIHSGRDSGLC